MTLRLQMMVAGCQVKGLYKNEKNDTFFVKKVGENEYFNLKNEEKKEQNSMTRAI